MRLSSCQNLRGHNKSSTRTVTSKSESAASRKTVGLRVRVGCPWMPSYDCRPGRVLRHVDSLCRGAGLCLPRGLRLPRLGRGPPGLPRDRRVQVRVGRPSDSDTVTPARDSDCRRRPGGPAQRWCHGLGGIVTLLQLLDTWLWPVQSAGRIVLDNTFSRARAAPGRAPQSIRRRGRNAG